MSIDGLHGKPNSTRLILYRNHYNEKGLLCWTEGIEERKMGKWIDDCTCSICHWIHDDEEGFALLTNYHFCPNCGADMRGETDG